MIYTIRQVHPETRQWTSGAGAPMISYRLQLATPEGTMLEAVELSQKASSPPPAPGQTLDAEVAQNGSYGLKAKKNFTQGGGGRGMTPEDRKMIVRQHTQKVLPDWLELMFTLGVVEQPTSKKEFLDLSTGVMDWLVSDVRRASS